jgi:sugar phosphate isomerase/epimerase
MLNTSSRAIRLVATATIILACLLTSAYCDEPAREFGVMANSNDMRSIPVSEVAAAAGEIGYKHVALSCSAAQLADQIKTFRDNGIQVGAIYVGWSTDGETVQFNIPIDEVFAHLEGTGGVVMIHTSIRGGEPVSDERIAEQMLPLAEKAEAAGLTIAIYPHVGNRLETLAQATAVADLVDHPSLGVCFNLCHYLKQNDPEDLPDSLRAAAHRIKLTSINGADVGDTQSMGWERLIQQLNQGDFDLEELLTLLCGELEFDGPIYVQCYNLKAPSRTILQETWDRWQELKACCE